MIKTLPARLDAALVSDLRPGMVPDLPEWYPLDRVAKGDEPAPPPYSDAERRELRRRKAIDEALVGPYDGQRGIKIVFDTETGPPETWVPITAPAVRYRLSRRESSRDELVYRYDPTCSLHAEVMRGVADAYRQTRQDYTIAAREEADHERSAPTKL